MRAQPLFPLFLLTLLAGCSTTLPPREVPFQGAASATGYVDEAQIELDGEVFRCEANADKAAYQCRWSPAGTALTLPAGGRMIYGTARLDKEWGQSTLKSLHLQWRSNRLACQAFKPCVLEDYDPTDAVEAKAKQEPFLPRVSVEGLHPSAAEQSRLSLEAEQKRAAEKAVTPTAPAAPKLSPKTALKAPEASGLTDNPPSAEKAEAKQPVAEEVTRVKDASAMVAPRENGSAQPREESNAAKSQGDASKHEGSGQPASREPIPSIFE